MMATAVEMGITIAVMQGEDVKQRSKKRWRVAIGCRCGRGVVTGDEEVLGNQ